LGNRQQRTLTKEDLREYDGEQGKPAYVAFNGKIYDVSKSTLWKSGTHGGRHNAGEDLTASMSSAPHGDEVLTEFPVVGKLKEITNKIFSIGFVEKLHLHPIMVHFSIAYAVIVPLLAFLYFATSQICFESASYYMLIFGFLSTPLSVLSGTFAWKVTYKGKMNKIFFRKIILAVLLLAVITIALAMRVLDPNIITVATYVSGIYLTLLVSLVPINVVLGYYGGEIVYP
jgi:predicted heme/steroid binding protein/uncharacterized membrane protein